VDARVLTDAKEVRDSSDRKVTAVTPDRPDSRERPDSPAAPEPLASPDQLDFKDSRVPWVNRGPGDPPVRREVGDLLVDGADLDGPDLADLPALTDDKEPLVCTCSLVFAGCVRVDVLQHKEQFFGEIVCSASQQAQRLAV